MLLKCVYFKATFPYEWQPKIVTTQLLKIGNVIITAVPGELTTMAGRRLRNNVQNNAKALGLNNTEVILAGLSNVYSSYIVTYEEYQVYTNHTHYCSDIYLKI